MIMSIFIENSLRCIKFTKSVLEMYDIIIH